MQDHNYYFSGEKIKDVLLNKPGHEEEELEETRVFLGVAFSRWTSLKRDKSFKSDAEVACFLLDSYERVVMTSAPTKEKPSQVPAPAITDTTCSFNSYQRVVMTSLATKEKPVQVIGPAAFGATPSLSGANRFPYPRLPNGVGMRPVTNLQPPNPRILKMVVFVPPRSTSGLTQIRRNAQDAPQLNAGLRQRVIDHLQLKKTPEEGPTKMEPEERCIKMEPEERRIEEEQEECCIKMELEEHRIKIEVEERRIETELEERRIINQQERHEKEEQEECHLKDEHKERQIKEEQEEHHINSEEVEGNLNGIREADITGFLLTSVHVKSENGEKKPQSPQPHQGPPLKNIEAQTQTRGSGKRMKTETEDDRGSKKARNSYYSSCLPQNTNVQASDFTETKDTEDGDNYWQEPLSASEPETEDGKSKNSNLHQSLSESGSETEDSSIENYNLHRSSSESGSETEDSSIDNYNLHRSSSESGSETEDSSIDNYNLHGSSSESGSETEDSSIDVYNLHGSSSESGSETESSSSLDNYDSHGPSSKSGSETESSSSSSTSSSVDNYNLHRPSSESGSETEGSSIEDDGNWRKPLLNSEPKLVNSGANGKKRFHTPEKPFRCKI
ncbi:uncharacterized protein DDB_G0283697-like isoform X2 [Neolamprologus brichardi]|uniref:uncharacterized protein DDB_G0283697-like isoform X2 n=1 Tax=Neolamprologus brichardi TaxID=32507 RepID=UPI0003EC22DF|nr:uncharacterized protein DDB_G0283697-like isoform X2 [Neolamprologus brichardi]